MPHYYLTSFVGTGTDANPFRARGMGVGATMIDLRPNGANQAGFALLALPAQTSIPGARYLGDDLLGALPLAVRQGLANDLGITLDALTFRQAVLELLSQHARTDGTRWKPLRPGRDGMWRVFLGGLLWEAPTVSGGASYSDDFNVADNTALSGDLTWTEFHNAAWETVSNTARIIATGANGARAEHNHDTDDHWAQCTVVTFTRASGSCDVGPLVRKNSGDNIVTYYMFRAAKAASVDEHRLTKMVSNTATDLQIVATAHVANDVLKVQADGSTIKGFRNGSEVASQTDTEITGYLQAGLRGQKSSSGSVVIVDDYSSGDVSAATVVDGTAMARQVARNLASPLVSTQATARALQAQRGLSGPQLITISNATARQIARSISTPHALTPATARAQSEQAAETAPAILALAQARGVNVQRGVVSPVALTLASVHGHAESRSVSGTLIATLAAATAREEQLAVAEATVITVTGVIFADGVSVSESRGLSAAEVETLFSARGANEQASLGGAITLGDIAMRSQAEQGMLAAPILVTNVAALARSETRALLAPYAISEAAALAIAEQTARADATVIVSVGVVLATGRGVSEAAGHASAFVLSSAQARAVCESLGLADFSQVVFASAQAVVDQRGVAQALLLTFTSAASGQESAGGFTQLLVAPPFGVVTWDEASQEVVAWDERQAEALAYSE